MPRQAAMVLAARQSGTALTGRVVVDRSGGACPHHRGRAAALRRRRPRRPLAGARPRRLDGIAGDVDPADRPAARRARRRDADRGVGERAVAPPTPRAWTSRSASPPTACSRLDLVADGPHALIGGTSGAGKSELLQSIVASLAVRHAPTRLTFLFVDYKGGAASAVFSELPHTVGYVTNLERRAVAAGADVPAGRAEPAHAPARGQGQGPRRDARAVPRRRPAVAGHRRRRVRHARQGGPRVRRRHRRHRPARPQPRHPPDPRHAAPVGRGERQHPRQHQPAHLVCACSTRASRSP